MIGKVKVTEVEQNFVESFSGQNILLVYVVPKEFTASLFVISYDENDRLFSLALRSNGVIINMNDESYDEDVIDFVCDLSEKDDLFRKGELDVRTYQLHEIFNHHVEEGSEIWRSFDYVSICSFVPQEVV